MLGEAGRRVARLGWLVAVNGGCAAITFERLKGSGVYRGPLESQVIVETGLEIMLPIVGIVMELFKRRFARQVNVGCFVACGIFWLVEAALNWSDPFMGVWVIGVGFLMFASITAVVYERTKSDVEGR